MKTEHPYCCGIKTAIFKLKKAGGWVAHCVICWDGTEEQPTKKKAIEKWHKTCT